ncbi:MAG: antitoxin VbhA family protein [Helicobacteraceae bacterium]|jgi:hypothetical protein|nr:antitoxin VbhA family protein [Helicobacteraceae bacterium]
METAYSLNKIESKTSRRSVAAGEKKPISDEERAKRLAAVEHANASMNLEGYKLSAEEEDRQRRFINGELTLEEFIGQ